jgi:hypothetical protein
VNSAGAGAGPTNPVDVALRVMAGFIAFGLGAASAIYEALLSALYWHHDRLPLSLVIALIANPALAIFAYWGTGRLLGILAPAAPWLIVMVLAASRTTEGDLIFTNNNWVGIATLFVGSIAFALGTVPAMRWAATQRSGLVTVDAWRQPPPAR